MADQAQIDELTQKMAEERTRLLDVLERLDDAGAARPTTGEGEWSAKQQMSHLCEMETAYRAWVGRALQERQRATKPAPAQKDSKESERNKA